MNDHKFLNAVGNISDEYLLEALSYRERKKMVKYFSKAAAAILLAMHLRLFKTGFIPVVHTRTMPLR